MKRTHVFITGKVQGVWFRESTKKEALALRVKGWVRNLVDGRVEAVFEGPDHAVDALVAWCRHGPGGADVTNVEATVEEPQGLPDFRVLR